MAGTHGPLDPAWADAMTGVMQVLDHSFNGDLKAPDKKVGIVILMFPYGEAASGRTNYISNGAQREDMVLLLRELADRFEGTHPEEQADG